MQNAKNQNLLKLWLSFFCLSLANALASDSVGKIHAVHVNEVIRIKVIQTQCFSVWHICAGSLTDICQTNYYIHSSEWERPGIATTQYWCWTSPAEHLFPHFPYWVPWWECFPRRPWFSKVFEDSTLLKSNIPFPTIIYGRHAYIAHRSWTRGTACLLYCYLHRMWSSQEPETLLTGMKVTSLSGTCMHITTRLEA